MPAGTVLAPLLERRLHLRELLRGQDPAEGETLRDPLLRAPRPARSVTCFTFALIAFSSTAGAWSRS